MPNLIKQGILSKIKIRIEYFGELVEEEESSRQIQTFHYREGSILCKRTHNDTQFKNV